MTESVEAGAVPLLPPGFEQLEPLAGWSLKTETERIFRRQKSSFADIVAFRDAIVPELERIFAHLASHSGESASIREERLLGMVLSLAEIAPAVECYQQPGVIDGFDPFRFLPVENCRLRPPV